MVLVVGLVVLLVVVLVLGAGKRATGGLVCRASWGALLWGRGRGERVRESLRGELVLLPPSSTPGLLPTILHSQRESASSTPRNIGSLQRRRLGKRVRIIYCVPFKRIDIKEAPNLGRGTEPN